jgi:hypothetical protein
MINISYKFTRCIIYLAILLGLSGCSQKGPTIIDKRYITSTDTVQKQKISGQKYRFSIVGYDKSKFATRSFSLLLEAKKKIKIYERKIYIWSDGHITRDGWNYVTTKYENFWSPSANQNISAKVLSRAFLILNNENGLRTNNQGIFTIKFKLQDKLLGFVSDPLNTILKTLTSYGYVLDIKIVEAISVKKDNAQKILSIKLSSGLRALKNKTLEIYNKEIVPVRVNVMDKNTRASIPDVDMLITGPIVPPEKIIGKYIKDPFLVAQATRFFPKYVQGSESFSSSFTGVNLHLYPNSYVFKAKHPKYYYKEKRVRIGESTENVNLMLSDVGTKMRVQRVME